MFTNKIRTLRQQGGFTIVELLVVIVVIAILASIVIVSYNGIIQRAGEASVMADVNQNLKQLALYEAQNSGYPSNCATANVKVASGNELTCNVSSNGNTFCLSVKRGTTSYVVTNTEQTAENGLCSGTAKVKTGTEFTAIASGQGASCGIVAGKAYCWGTNYIGQLGNGTTSDATVPTKVTDTGVLAGKTVTDISIGDAHGCAVASGAAYCWGEGSRGQLGQGVAADSTTPVAVSTSGVLAGKTVTKISANGDQTCLVADGAAYCFGDSYQGALGNGVSARTVVSSPVAVTASGVLAGKTVTDIFVGGYYSYNGCVIASGAAYCWGVNGWGQVGNNSTAYVTTPVAVSTAGALSGKTVTDIAMYEYHTCAVASGAAYCWGGNGNGYLGTGNTTSSLVPVAVSTAGVLAGKTVTAISPGDYHTCAVANGAAYCWGNGTQGQLGNSGMVDSYVPVAVTATGVLAGKTVTAIAAGYNHTCALADARVHCWGDTVNWWPGSLGNGGSTGSNTPVLTTTPTL